MTELTKKFDEALLYASEAHRNQKRKGTECPYLAHLLGAADIALEYGADENEAIAALLHDCVEDQGGPPRLAEIRQKFGDTVARIVKACSDTDRQPKPEWKQRKLGYLDHLRKAAPDERLIAAADKIQNARSILSDHRQVGAELWSRFKAGRDGSLWYYREVVKALDEVGGGPYMKELASLVDAMQDLD